MTTAAKSKGLYQKLLAVLESVDYIPKNGYNSFHKYSYAMESDVTNSMREKFVEQGLVFLPSHEDVSITQREGKSGDVSFLTTVKIHITIIDAETGEKAECDWFGTGEDKGDKGLYKASTGGVKTWLMKTFMSPTGDDPERDDEKPQNGNGRQQHQAQPKQKSGDNGGGMTAPMSDAQRGKIFALAKDLNISKTNLESQVKLKFNKTIENLTKSDASGIIKTLDDMKEKSKKPAKQEELPAEMSEGWE